MRATPSASAYVGRNVNTTPVPSPKELARAIGTRGAVKTPSTSAASPGADSARGGRQPPGSRIRALTTRAAAPTPAITAKNTGNPNRRTRISPTAGPTAMEMIPEMPKTPRAWPRRSAGTTSTTSVKLAMKNSA
jgi:hypothetical protein